MIFFLLIFQASAKQRSNCCRNGGMVLRLYPRSSYESSSDVSDPEILDCPLVDLCLRSQVVMAGDQPLDELLADLPTQPGVHRVAEAVDILKGIGAMDSQLRVTALGMKLLCLPVEPRLAKMILTGVTLKCLDPVLTIACCLARDDPFVTPACPEKRGEALARKYELSADSLSDHMALLRSYHLWEKTPEAVKRQVQVCK